MKIELFYDKECPFCNCYANYIKLKEEHDLNLINIRKKLKENEIFKSQGFDINDGFIIRVDEKKIYQGVEAIVFLNKLSLKKIYLPNNKFFRHLIYKLIKKLRKIVLFLSNKKIDI